MADESSGDAIDLMTIIGQPPTFAYREVGHFYGKRVTFSDRIISPINTRSDSDEEDDEAEKEEDYGAEVRHSSTESPREEIVNGYEHEREVYTPVSSTSSSGLVGQPSTDHRMIPEFVAWMYRNSTDPSDKFKESCSILMAHYRMREDYAARST